MSVYPGMARSGPSEADKVELRKQSDKLIQYGYQEREARQLVWDVYQGGIRAVKACMRIRTDIPDVGETDIRF